MDVLISITGTQLVDGERDTIELTTTGGMDPAEDGWRLTYEESAATGMEGVTTAILIKPEDVYKRQAQSYAKKVLEAPDGNASFQCGPGRRRAATAAVGPVGGTGPRPGGGGEGPAAGSGCGGIFMSEMRIWLFPNLYKYVILNQE